MLETEVLRRFVTYKPDTGELFWKPRGDPRWDKRFAGRLALRCLDRNGYYRGPILGKWVSAHRAIWALHFGEWPKDEIDHINGNPSDNRIENLRSVSKADNNKNKAISKTNKSGVTGVRWRKRDNLWDVTIGVNGKRVQLGSTPFFERAVEIRRQGEAKYGFHPNHGRLAA